MSAGPRLRDPHLDPAVTPALALPPPLELPDGHDRRTPTPTAQREAVLHLAAQADWAALDWPGLMSALVRLGGADVVLARLTEGHADALRILSQAGLCPRPDAAYAVWASRSRGTGLHAERVEGAWVLDGTLRFASGAGIVDRALVPVWDADGAHHLLDLDVSGWDFDASQWATPAMAQSRSHVATLDREVAPDETTRVVGPPDFYLSRHEFHLGGVGVAAVWAGCACRVLALAESAVPAARRDPAQRRRLGLALTEALTALAVVRAAGEDCATTDDPRALATWTRSAVSACATRLVDHVREIAGAAALAFDADLAAACADLPLYLAQHPADASATWLGEARAVDA